MGGSIEVAPKDLSKFKMKAGEVGVYGEVCVHTDGLTKAAADDSERCGYPYGVCGSWRRRKSVLDHPVWCLRPCYWGQ